MTELQTGRVIRVDAKVCHVDLGDRVVHASPRGSLFENLQQKNPVAVGDLVKVSVDGDPVGLESVEPRRNYLGRTASSHDPREQVLVANVDQLFMIGSVEKPKFSSVRTDRILAACCWHDIPAVLVLNKIDLADSEQSASIRETYERIPIPVIETCATDGRGVDELAALLKDKVSVLYGPSGAGKSTLLNHIQPGLKIKEGKISRYWDQGKHTTSFSSLFPDFAPFAKNCHYKACTHDHEPDCAVWDAVDSGELAASRYASYVDMLDEIDPANAYEAPEGEGEGDPLE